MTHDSAVQDCVVLPQKLPKSRIIESLYIAEVRGLQTRVEVRKMYNYRPEVLEYLIFKYPKVEVETWQVFSWQDRTSSTSTGAYDIKEQYKVQEILFISIIIIYWVNKW